MNTPKTILVIDIGTDNFSIALARAAEIAAHNNAALHVLTCRPANVAAISRNTNQQKKSLFHQARRERLEFIESSIRQLASSETLVEIHTVWHREVVDAILCSSEMLEPDLLVKAFEPQTRAEKALVLSIDSQLIQNCDLSLLLVKEAHWQTGGEVLAAINAGSDQDKEIRLNHDILDYTQMIAGQFQLTPSLLSTHVTPLVDPAEGNKGQAFVQHRDDIVATQQANIDSLVNSFDYQLENRHVVEGLIEERISEYAEANKVQLVVLGNHRRKGVAGAMVGNTAEKVLALGKCEVLTLPA